MRGPPFQGVGHIGGFSRRVSKTGVLRGSYGLYGLAAVRQLTVRRKHQTMMTASDSSLNPFSVSCL